jgi:hypothetical protein
VRNHIFQTEEMAQTALDMRVRAIVERPHVELATDGGGREADIPSTAECCQMRVGCLDMLPGMSHYELGRKNQRFGVALSPRNRANGKDQNIMADYSGLTNEEISMLIHHREAQGHQGVNDPVLHDLNCEQTDRMSVQKLLDAVYDREGRGLSAVKARAALRDRGY